MNHHQSQGSKLDPFSLWFIAVTFGDLLLFVIAYSFAMKSRKTPLIHARYMVCTGIVFFPAIFDRISMGQLLSPSAIEMLPVLGENPLPVVFSYSMVFVVLLGLAVWDRPGKKGEHVFVRMVGIFAFIYAVPFLLFNIPIWKSIAAWYISLPIA